jgi:hypothetical protein
LRSGPSFDQFLGADAAGHHRRPVGGKREQAVQAGLNMNARVRELIAIALVSAFCAGVALMLDREWFVPIFLALSVLAGVAAIRRLV